MVSSEPLSMTKDYERALDPYKNSVCLFRCNIFVNYLTISYILITFTLVPYHSSKIHTHYPLTSKLFVLFFFKWLTHSPSPVYAFHILTGLEPCTGSWSTYQGPHSQRKLTPLSHPTPTHQISIAPPEWRCVCPSPTHASLLTGQCDLEQILHRQP